MQQAIHHNIKCSNTVTGKTACSAACLPVLHLLSGLSALQGRHVALINVKFGTGEWTIGQPHAKFHVYWDRNVGIQPPKWSQFGILPTNVPLRGDSFAQFL